MMQRPRKWSGLQARMTISYVLVTVVAVLLLELLVFGLIAFSVLKSGNGLVPKLRQTAKQYAHTISAQVKDTTLDSHPSIQLGDSEFPAMPGQSISGGDHVLIPRISTLYPKNESFTFGLLVAPNKHIVASSYLRRYTIGTPVSQLLPNKTALIDEALGGRSVHEEDVGLMRDNSASAVEPIWNSHHKLIGAMYVQTPLPSIGWSNLLPLALSLAGSGVVLLIVVTPIGAFFGIVTTYGTVRRLRSLATATTLFANGNYSLRLRVTRKDEVGQLEDQFNRMAEQLVVSIEKQKELAEQNARLAERSRISRELHDAISQDLFSLRMLAGGLQTALPSDSPVYPQVATLEQTTTNMIREMRALLLELRPTQLEHLGLAESLEELAATYRTRLGTNVKTDITSVSLSARTQHTLLRITQEAMANAARHANATTITLSLVPLPQAIQLTILDDGKGFYPHENGKQHGLGLRLMQERVQELNGTFLLHTTPCQGTQLHVCLPRE